ncbi:MAG: inositol monophosphatase family protein [Eubacteriales bacterium]|nr:inositol monophosphatase family protein [Eubacteriales bacterium]
MLSPNLYTQIESIIRSAGQKIKSASVTSSTVHQKEGLANFVTNFDIEIQKFLIREFSAILPEAGFYGEEDTEGSGRDLTEPYIFYIDPIDGTTNFIFGYQFSCVSVGLAYKGTVIAGFVYNPYTDSMYKAVRGEGAYMNDRPLHIENKSIEEGIVAFGCARYNEGDTDLLFATVKELYLRSLCVRNGGSAALDLCRVAAGANTVYFELKLQPYDYAAASIIIEEAGGVITQVDGQKITLDAPCSILAGTVKACEEVKTLMETL